MSEKKYHLQKWSDRDKALLCPQCQKGHGCYKVYVDDDGNEVDPTNHLCGKCDHTTHCGYHMPPREWFRLNPGQRQAAVAEAAQKSKVQVKRIEIPFHMVEASAEQYERNNFVRFLYSLPWNDEELKALDRVLANYYVGTTRAGQVIWWQIDSNARVRTGKMMQYNPETGKRLKDAEGNSIGFGWVHAQMRRMGHFLPEQEWDIVQCLFGEHLASLYEQADIHIVESEKSAVLMAISDPLSFSHHLWMATGGLYNMKAEKLLPFRGRKMVAYPDANGVELWADKLKGLPVTLSTGWMSSLTPEDPAGADIADVMLRRMRERTADPLALMKQANPLLEKLIDKMKLECVKTSRLTR